MVNVSFRIATYNDVPKIIELCNQCFNENTSLEYAYKVFKQTENDPNQIYIIGEIQDKVIAHAKITIIPTIYENMNTYAILNHVCVREDYRRHNIATLMLDEITKICKDKKCVKMELWSMNFRQAAHACYINYGFNIDDAKFFSKEIKRD